MTDQTGFVAIANILPKLNSLVLLIALARFLPKEIYGTYDQIIMVSAFAYAFLAAGHISESLYFFLPQLCDEKKKIFLTQSIILLLCLGVFGGVATNFLAEYLGGKFQNPNLPVLLSSYCTYITFWIAKDFFPHFLIIEGKLKLSIIVNFLDSLTNVVFLLVPITTGLGLQSGFHAVSYLAAIKFLLFTSYVIRVNYPVPMKFDFQLLADQFKFCFPLTLSSWVEIIGIQFGKIVISLAYPPATVAIYAVGSLNIPIWQVITKSSNAILRIRFAELYAKNEFDEIISIWAQAIRKLSLISCPIIFFLFVSAESLINIIFTSKYQESIVIFKILLGVNLLSTISTSLIPISTGNTKIITYGSFLSVSINIVLCIIFVQLFGYKGPAIATVISFYIVSFFYLHVSAKIMKINLKKLLPLEILSKILVVNSLSALACFPAKLAHMNDYTMILLDFIVFATSYTLLILRFNLLTEDDKITLLKWIKLSPFRK